jgi:GxxExxY protein
LGKVINHEGTKTPRFKIFDRENIAMEKTRQAAHQPIVPETEKIASAVVDSAFRVHTNLGAGLLESVYEICLCYELQKHGLNFERQVALPIVYDGVKLSDAFRLDILVEKQIILEIKAVNEIMPVFEAQLLTYLRLTNLRLGFLINFNVPMIKSGIKRMVN